MFDREKNSSFEFLLVASDGGGSGPRNSTARIRITVSDVNDNAPMFRQVPYKITASQSTRAGETVLQVMSFFSSVIVQLCFSSRDGVVVNVLLFLCHCSTQF